MSEMTNKSLSIDELVALKVQEEIAKYRPISRKISGDWLDVRKEILDYCSEHNYILHRGEFYSHTSVRDSIYKPIRYILRLHRLDDMTDQQAVIAREIFEYIKTKAELVHSKENQHD